MLTRCRVVAVLAVALAILGSAACEKVPLLAPTGSTITLTAPTNALAVNGTVDIVAQVLEAAGSPPHSGTHVNFTTTLGTISPSDAVTDLNGRVTVRFAANGTSGTAVITANSGGATTGSNGAIRIAVGSAAVGRVNLSANPNPISANGGVASIVASVIDLNGNALPNVPVSFSTTSGSLGNAVVNTDGSGNATTTLSTNSQATVTATVGVQSSSSSSGTSGTGSTGTGSSGSTGSTSTQASATITVNVNPLPTVAITAPSGTLVANSPIVFTLNVAVGTNSTAQVRNVVVDFGDGTRNDLGAAVGSALTVAHQFGSEGTYVVRATVTDTLGGTTQSATAVVVQPEPPLAVSLSSSQVASGGTTTTTFTATVTPTTATVATYLWNFGDLSSPETSTNPQRIHQYVTGSGPKTVTLTITTTTGRTATGQIVVNP